MEGQSAQTDRVGVVDLERGGHSGYTWKGWTYRQIHSEAAVVWHDVAGYRYWN